MTRAVPFHLILATCCAGLVIGCARTETEHTVREKLEIICADDLKTVISEVDSESVLDSTYYTVREYKDYREGKYSKRAVVEFVFLKNVTMKMVRKYRYYPKWKKWERYYNRYEFVHD